MSNLDLNQFSERTQLKARKVNLENVNQLPFEPTMWDVESSRNGKIHRVEFIAGDYIQCSCLYGNHNGGSATCYHACAALMAYITGIREGTVRDMEDERTKEEEQLAFLRLIKNDERTWNR